MKDDLLCACAVSRIRDRMVTWPARFQNVGSWDRISIGLRWRAQHGLFVYRCGLWRGLMSIRGSESSANAQFAMDDKHEIRPLRVRTTRRKFLRAGAMVGMAGALGLAVDSTIIEPADPKLVRIEVPLARLPEAWDGIRIAQVSDFHYDEHFSVVPIRKAIDIVNRLKA